MASRNVAPNDCKSSGPSKYQFSGGISGGLIWTLGLLKTFSSLFIRSVSGCGARVFHDSTAIKIFPKLLLRLAPHESHSNRPCSCCVSTSRAFPLHHGHDFNSIFGSVILPP